MLLPWLDAHADGPGVILDARFIQVDDSPGWLDGDLGKLRHGEDDGPIVLGQAMLTWDRDIGSTVRFSGVASLDGERSNKLDLIESFLHWRPVPTSGYRHRINAGVFYPPFSEENVDRAWLSPYGFSNSAINAWIGEELRTIGAQYTLQRPGMFHGSLHDLSLNVAIFQGNDAAGTLLAWRGWGVHDRQTGIFERLSLAALPSFESDAAFDGQAQWLEPFREIDNRTGYYLGGEWDYGGRLRFHVHHYDNRGDPMALEERGGGYGSDSQEIQYAWHTRFTHAGWRFELPNGVELFGQWMEGNTLMGADDTLVDADFESAYLMVSRAFGDHRLSLRHDVFQVRDRAPGTEMDNTNEDGDAWMVAWRWRLDGHWQVGAEWLLVDSRRPARAYFGEAEQLTESLFQVGAQWRF